MEEKIIKSVNSLVLDIVNTLGNTQKNILNTETFQVGVWDPYGSLKLSVEWHFGFH